MASPNSRNVSTASFGAPPSGYDTPDYSPALTNDNGDDPYRRYSRGAASQFSVLDDGSHRELHRGMGGRRSSNLGYGEKEAMSLEELNLYKNDERQRAAKHAKYGAAGAAPGGLPRSGGSWWSRKSAKTRKWLIIALVLVILIIAGAAAGAAAGIVTSRKNKYAAPNTGATTTSSAPMGVPTGTKGADWHSAAYGGDGSIIYAANGDSFRYNNTFG